jgi:hypothetical protein
MPFWAIFAIAVVSFALTSLLTPHPHSVEQKPAELTDFQVPQWEEGTPEAVIFGDVWIIGWIVLWYGNLRSTAIIVKNKKK